jgi:hypothetical protein
MRRPSSRIARRPAHHRSRRSRSPDRFGLRRIGQVAELPMSALIARFGEEGGRLHAGHVARRPSRSGAACDEAPRARAADRAPVEDLEPLRFVLHRSSPGLTAQLTARGLAADRAILALELDLCLRRRTAPSPGSRSSNGSPSRPRTPRRSSGCCSQGWNGSRRRPRSSDSSSSCAGRTPAAGQQLPLFVPQAARTRQARLAARTACTDLRGGSGQAGRDRRPGSAASRGPLELARRRLGNVGPEGSTRMRPGA